MNYGCQSMVDKITDIMIKRPQEAYKNQEFINENYEACKYYGIPDMEKCIEEYKVFENIIKENVENVWYLPEDVFPEPESQALLFHTHHVLYYTQHNLP